MLAISVRIESNFSTSRSMEKLTDLGISSHNEETCLLNLQLLKFSMFSKHFCRVKKSGEERERTYVLYCQDINGRRVP